MTPLIPLTYSHTDIEFRKYAVFAVIVVKDRIGTLFQLGAAGFNFDLKPYEPEYARALPEWQPIATAPKDKVILTDQGTACYVDQRGWGSPVTNGWYLCDTGDNIPTCADDGMSISAIEPKLWMPMPPSSEERDIAKELIAGLEEVRDYVAAAGGSEMSMNDKSGPLFQRLRWEAAHGFLMRLREVAREAADALESVLLSTERVHEPAAFNQYGGNVLPHQPAPSSARPSKEQVEALPRYWHTGTDGIHLVERAPDGKGSWLSRKEVLALFSSADSATSPSNDAARWRALFECSRIRVLGYARGGPHGRDGSIRHIGFEFTTDQAPYCDLELKDGRERLTEFTDAILNKTEGGGS